MRRNDAARCADDGLGHEPRRDSCCLPGRATRIRPAFVLSPHAQAAAAARIPLMGVCLGHQTIGEAFGGKVVRCHEIVHGKMGTIHHEGKSVFADLPSPFEATRYHSLVVERESLPDCLEVTAELSDGTIMGLAHRELAHPWRSVSP